MHLCGHHLTQGIEHSHHSQKFPHIPFQALSTFLWFISLLISFTSSRTLCKLNSTTWLLCLIFIYIFGWVLNSTCFKTYTCYNTYKWLHSFFFFFFFSHRVVLPSTNIWQFVHLFVDMWVFSSLGILNNSMSSLMEASFFFLQLYNFPLNFLIYQMGPQIIPTSYHLLKIKCKHALNP